jgi:hypothetical protein
MRAQFVRGQDPKDSLEIGLPHKRFIVEAEKALRELSDEYGGEIIIEDPTWQGEGNVRVTLSFQKGYKMAGADLPLPSGYRYRLEYETGKKYPMTVSRSMGGGDWMGSYIEDIKSGQEMIKGFIENFMTKYLQKRFEINES